jgi:hypothetical protein
MSTLNPDAQIDSSTNGDTVGASSMAAADVKAPSGGALDSFHTNHENIVSTQEIMNLLGKQLDISRVIVETKDGQRITASFHESSTRRPSADSASTFKSIDMLKSLFSTGELDSVESNVAKGTTSLESLKDGTPLPVTVNRKVGAPNPLGSNLGSNPFESREWTADYANTHVEVSYSSCFTDGLAPAVAPSSMDGNGLRAFSELIQGAAAAAAGETSLPPKKRAARDAAGGSAGGKTDWLTMYNSALKPLVEAASWAQKEQPAEVGAGRGTGNTSPHRAASKMSAGASSSPAHPKKKRKPRKIVPEVKQFVTFTDLDVLFGRGGRSNHVSALAFYF